MGISGQTEWCKLWLWRLWKKGSRSTWKPLPLNGRSIVFADGSHHVEWRVVSSFAKTLQWLLRRPCPDWFAVAGTSAAVLCGYFAHLWVRAVFCTHLLKSQHVSSFIIFTPSYLKFLSCTLEKALKNTFSICFFFWFIEMQFIFVDWFYVQLPC